MPSKLNNRWKGPSCRKLYVKNVQIKPLLGESLDKLKKWIRCISLPKALSIDCPTKEMMRKDDKISYAPQLRDIPFCGVCHNTD